MGNEFGVTIIARAKHQVLYQAAKKLGSAIALAKAIGVNQYIIGRWINLKSYPKESYFDAHPDLEQRLMDVTEMLLEELWPAEVRAAIDGKPPTSIEVEQILDLHLLEHTGFSNRLLPSVDDEIIEEENAAIQAQSIGAALMTLTYREKEIVKLRYGLAGGHQYSMQEVGQIFKITIERVRQIEAKAIRKLSCCLINKEGRITFFPEYNRTECNQGMAN